MSPRAGDVRSTAGNIESVRTITTNTDGSNKRRKNHDQPSVRKRVRFETIDGEGKGDYAVLCSVEPVAGAALVEKTPDTSSDVTNRESCDIEATTSNKSSNVPSAESAVTDALVKNFSSFGLEGSVAPTIEGFCDEPRR